VASFFQSEKQRALFLELASTGELIFACGPSGISANLCGFWRVQRYPENKEDRLEVGDGTHHVHVNWERVKRVDHSTLHGEGVLTFFDGDEKLFRFYRPAGDFSDSLKQLIGPLL